MWQDGWSDGTAIDASQNVYGMNIQGGAFLTDDLELFGAWCYSDTTGADATQNWLQMGANWYFAKNNVKMTVMGVLPMNGSAARNPSLRGFGSGVGLQDAAAPVNNANNFSLVAQLQVMF